MCKAVLYKLSQNIVAGIGMDSAILSPLDVKGFQYLGSTISNNDGELFACLSVPTSLCLSTSVDLFILLLLWLPYCMGLRPGL